MTKQNETKINQILQSQPVDAVYLTSYLKSKGISQELLHHYVKSGWFDKVGTGAFKRKGEKINWISGVYAIQNQTDKLIHVGGMTALRLHGFVHYIRTSDNIHLFTDKNMRLPKWFSDQKHTGGIPILHRATFLPMIDQSFAVYDGHLDITISSPERALLEALYLCPKSADLVEVYQVFEGLTNLRPKLVQKLLEECSSVKVKRLFLYMAKKASHQWSQFISVSNIDLGKGKRSLDKGWVYIADYQITVPKELADL